MYGELLGDKGSLIKFTMQTQLVPSLIQAGLETSQAIKDNPALLGREEEG